MWRFLREMKVGDLVVTPHGPAFYVGEVASGPSHSPEFVEDDTAFRRSVRWLNGKRPIPRTQARAALAVENESAGHVCVRD
jgi:predicted Mrr-cat superfamily restriction endonuclease